MTTFQYKNVTPEALANLRTKLVAGGAVITVAPHDATPAPAATNQFRVTGHGITSDATYDPATSTLTVSVVSKPWIIPVSAIDKGIKEALAAA